MKVKDAILGFASGLMIGGMIYLFIEFPLTMITIFVLFLAFMFYLMKKAPYDYELWPDLYQKPPLP